MNKLNQDYQMKTTTKFLLRLLLMVTVPYVIIAEERILITINQFGQHTALEQAYKGIEKALKDKGLLPQKVDIKLNNAQGNISNAVHIAQHHASLKPQFMIAIATQSAQASLRAKAIESILGFVAVTNPEAAGLTQADKIIGVNDAPPVKELLSIIQELLRPKTIGVVFNPGETNSVKIVEEITHLAAKENIIVEKAAVHSSAEIKLATQKLIGKAEIIYLPQDNLVVSAIDTILQLANKAKIPLVSNDPHLVDKGVLLALGCNYFDSGIQLGNMIANIIENGYKENIINPSDNHKLKINQQVAKMLNINIPSEIELREQQ